LARSGPESTCWLTVGAAASPVVDTWTSRRPCTPTVVCPPAVPWFPQCASPGAVHGAGPADAGEPGVRSGAAHTSRSGACGQRGDVDGTTARPRTGVTTREVVPTRYPQTVHIPGDNSSTSRRTPGRSPPLRGHRRGLTPCTRLCTGVEKSTRDIAVLPDRTAARCRPRRPLSPPRVPAGDPPGPASGPLRLGAVPGRSARACHGEVPYPAGVPGGHHGQLPRASGRCSAAPVRLVQVLFPESGTTGGRGS
jgi:hypothetical protein